MSRAQRACSFVAAVSTACTLLCASLAAQEAVVPSSSPAAVKVFDLAQSGDVPPTREISGASTGLVLTFGTLVDTARREIYVADFSGDAIRVFALGDNGDVAPLRQIVGASTGIDSPIGLALDPATGELFVKTYGDDDVLAFPRLASGNVAPSRVLTSAVSLGLNSRAVMVDPVHRELYVTTEAAAGAVHVFALGAAGVTAPLRTLSGAATLLNAPGSMALDLTHDELFVVVAGNVLTFPRTQSGNAAPTRSFSVTNSVAAAGIALDAVPDELVISGQSSNGHVLVYSRTATGAAVPLRDITGAATGLNNNAMLSIAPTPRFADGFESGATDLWSTTVP